MNIVQITPGAGGMFCGNCLRDNGFVTALRKQGHRALLVPLYLPLTLDEPDQSAGTPIFFSGLKVYLDQHTEFFRKAPDWLRNTLDSPKLLKWAAGKAAKTRAEEVGDLALSMIRGEEGNQARELDELVAWLKQQSKPDVICLSNVLLVGLVRRIQAELAVPVVCLLQGEDAFLNALPETTRGATWEALIERAADVNLFIAPSHYFGGLMAVKLDLPEDRVRVVPNGISLDGYSPASRPPDPPVLGYFARMCPEKGLDTLVEAYLLLRQRERHAGLKLRVGGSCGPNDVPFVNELRQRLKSHGVLGDAEFHPNLDRAGKQDFYRSLTVFSVPALYGEAFGLYVIEAMASAVPVVQPRHGAFPELIQATHGGSLCEPGDVKSLADSIEMLLSNRILAQNLAENGRKAVLERFNVEQMTENTLEVLREVLDLR
jgi:glycosyltransferase involved in cell wall biosynthesis